MKYLKLIFKRFLETEGITIPIDMDTSGLSSGRQKVTTETNSIVTSIEKVIDANEKLAKTSADKRIGSMRLAQAGVNRFNTAKDLVAKQSVNPRVSAKTRGQLSTILSDVKTQGLDNLKIEQAGGMDANKVARISSMGNKLSSAGIKAATEEQKYYNEAAKQGIKYLEQQAKASLKANKDMSTFGKGMDNASKKASNFTNIMRKLAGAAVRWRILYGAFSRVWNILASTVDKAAAYEEAINLYTVALGEYAEQGRQWADRISSALYLDPKQIMQYTGAFYNLVEGLGVGSDAAYKMATNLTQLSYDMSSYLNIDVESAHDKLQSAITGQSRAVASAGIAMQQASLQELAYALGIKKSVSEMTQAEKTYLRYIQIMRSTKNMQTDLARTIVTPENALRVIRQQFNLLGRAIGQVFIPIIMKAIPYVMALTQALTKLAKWLGGKLGYEMADIKYDFSNLKSVDTAVEDTFDNIGTSAAKGAKSVKDSVSRTLAAFDELNVVESQGAGSPGGGGIGGVGGIPGSGIGDLEPYVEGYDMLKGLTDELSKNVDKAKENLKKFGEALKKVAIAIGIIKGLKWANDLIKWVERLRSNWKEGTGLAGLLRKTLVPAFKGLWETLKNGSSVFSRMIDASGNLTGSLWKLAGAWAGTGAAALAEGKIVESSYKSYLEGGSTIEATTLKVTAATTALGLAAGALTGPLGVLAVGIGYLVGATTAIMDYKAQLDQIAKNKEIYESIYDGQGIKVKELTGDIEGLLTNTNNYISGLDELKKKYEESQSSVDGAKTQIDDFKNALNTQKEAISNSQLDQLKTYYDEYIESIKNSATASKTYGQEIINSYSKMEGASKETTAQRISDYLEAQRVEEGYSLEYVKRAKEIDIQHYKNGKTAEWAAQEYHKLDVEFGLVAETTVNTTGVMDKFNNTVKDIDYSAMTPKELEQYFKDLSKTYNTTKENLEQAKTDVEAYFDGYIKKNEGFVKNLEETEEKQGYLTEAQKTRLAEYKKQIETWSQQKKEAVEGFTTGITEIDTKMKDTLAVIYADLKLQGADASTEFSGTIDTIKKDLGSLEKVDMSESGKKTLLTFIAGAKKTSSTMGSTYTAIFKTLGMDASKELQHGVNEGWISVQGEVKTGFLYSIDKVKPSIEKASEELGIAIPQGVTKGVTDKKELDKFYQANKKMAEQGGYIFKEANGIHSPSTVYEGFGKNMVMGLANGLSNNQNIAVKSIQGISKALSDVISNTKLSFKFSSDIDGPLNNMLDKIRSFANKWKKAINDLLKNMQTSMNSVKLDSKNKVTFTPMSGITIPAFAEGGYPTSGDLFFANENGNAEYITSLGNKTAVANQDQMINALTNAILQGMSAIETNRQPGITQVYIGNDKVYEGQGQYQNRQADRYGTTYVKI